jgi:hypothetical protein
MDNLGSHKGPGARVPIGRIIRPSRPPNAPTTSPPATTLPDQNPCGLIDLPTGKGRALYLRLAVEVEGVDTQLPVRSPPARGRLTV